MADALSLREVYEAHWRFVWRSVRKMGISESRIEDVVQDIFIVVSRQLEHFEGRSSIRTWLYGIAFRVAQEDHRRRLKEARPSQAPTENPAGPEAYAQRVQAAQLLHELLAELPEDQRIVFVMTDLDGLSPREVSESTGVGINTVYSRLRRAREHLERATERLRVRSQREGRKRMAAG
ncbi:MAG: RNA polymerase sigma factor [Nannocystaceae bacterium]|nr:RNA polymerase sigma factor [Nannocystaceae bacterium]